MVHLLIKRGTMKAWRLACDLFAIEAKSRYLVHTCLELNGGFVLCRSKIQSVQDDPCSKMVGQKNMIVICFMHFKDKVHVHENPSPDMRRYK